MNKLKITTASAASIASTTELDSEDLLTPTTTIASYLDNVTDKRQVSDPKTLVGQKRGAILAVKRTPTLGSYEESPEVGDLLVVLKSYNHYCDVLNMRNENSQTVPWEIFFPLTIGEKCCCPGGDCRCEVEDPSSFYAYRLASAGIGNFPPGIAAPKIPDAESSTSQKAVHPASLKGQTPGAIMIIQHKPHHVDGETFVEVGDHIEFLEGFPNEAWIIKARNLRTGGFGRLRWCALFPVGERETCNCYWSDSKAQCSCKYVDFEKSVAFQAKNM